MMNKRIYFSLAPLTLIVSSFSSNVAAQSLDHLACAAEIHCHDAGLTAEAVRAAYSIPNRLIATQSFFDESKQFPEHLWDCAINGKCKEKLSQQQAQLMLKLPADAFAQLKGLQLGKAADENNSSKAQQTASTSTPSSSTDSTGLDATTAALMAAFGAAAGSMNSGDQMGNALLSAIQGQITQAVEEEKKEAEQKTKTTSAENKKVLELAKNDIQPQDGDWHLTYGKTKSSGLCIAGMDAFFSHLALPPMSGNMTFEKPFHFSQIMPLPEITWKRVKTNHWKGVLTDGDDAVQVSWDIRTIDKTRIEGESIVTMAFPSKCTVTTPFTFARK